MAGYFIRKSLEKFSCRFSLSPFNSSISSINYHSRRYTVPSLELNSHCFLHTGRACFVTPRKDSKLNQHKTKRKKEHLLKRQKYTLYPKSKVIEITEGMTLNELAANCGVAVERLQEAIQSIIGKPCHPSIELKNIHFLRRLVIYLGFRWKMQKKNDKLKRALYEDKDEYKSLLQNTSFSYVRPPIITIMGHVDHGKTTLLDFLRETSVAAGEAGGITQKIGAFSVPVKGQHITFLDTPGHAAFSAMRKRGAQLTDIVVLIVAADDGIMEQTIESINMAKEANVPIIVTINKCDSKMAQWEDVVQQLPVHGLETEADGGDVQVVKISAKTGQGIPELIDAILVQSDLLGIQADPSCRVEGVIIESQVTQERGASASVVVQEGTLKKGMYLVAGTAFAKVRGLFDENNKIMESAPPATPATITGWRSLPSVGEVMLQVPTEMRAKEVVKWRENLKQLETDEEIYSKVSEIREREKDIYNETRKTVFFKKQRRLMLGEASQELHSTKTGFPQVNILVKADVDGSLDAIMNVLNSYDKHNKCKLHILGASVGSVKENDIVASELLDGTIVVFNIATSEAMEKRANSANVDILRFDIIYDLVNRVKEMLIEEMGWTEGYKINGEASVLSTFQYKKKNAVDHVAGCLVDEGTMAKSSIHLLRRNGEIIHKGPLASIKQLKTSVETVGYEKECGIVFEDTSVIPQTGDVIQCVDVLQLRHKLDWSPPGF